MLAIRRFRQTKVENPSAFFVLLMSLYCGIKGNTPPKIIAAADAILTTFVSVSSGMVKYDKMDVRASTADWMR